MLTYTQNRRAREKEARRHQILDAADAVFREHGFDGATIDRVAETAEVSKGLVYVYFSSKTELHHALTLRHLEALHEAAFEATQNDDAGLKKFRAFGLAYLSFAIAEPEAFAQMAQFESRPLRCDNDGYAALCQAQLDRIQELMVAVLEEGQRDGSLRADLPPRLAALTVWGLMHGVLQMAELQRRHIAEQHGIDSEALYAMAFRLIGVALASDEVRASDPESPMRSDWRTWFREYWQGQLSPRRESAGGATAHGESADGTSDDGTSDDEPAKGERP